MGKILIVTYLIGASITAFVMILLVSAAEVDMELDGVNVEDAASDTPVGKGMRLALAAVMVMVAAAGWIPLLLLMLRSAWREIEEDA